MLAENDRQLGAYIDRLIQKQDLSRIEARTASMLIIDDAVTEMQQGAFLAALAAKGETAEEVAGVWEAIYEADTCKVNVNGQEPTVDNSGTGMDTFKTFNISTAASILAAAGGIRMGRHGARAITSVCGTVDLAEALGVDVECSAEKVAESMSAAGIGLFNGMSPRIHPKALFRILSNICFGSTLNIAASLANPALPRYAVRGVYARRQILPVINVMRAIGYKRAIVFFGGIDGSELGMDEASVCGPTFGAELVESGEIREFKLHPAEIGFDVYPPSELSPADDITVEARRFVKLIRGKEKGARSHAVCLNAGMIFYISGKAESIQAGTELAARTIVVQAAYHTLEKWVATQNRAPEEGLKRLRSLN